MYGCPVFHSMIQDQVHITHQLMSSLISTKTPAPAPSMPLKPRYSAEDILRISYKQSTHRTDRSGRRAGGSQYLMEVVPPPTHTQHSCRAMQIVATRRRKRPVRASPLSPHMSRHAISPLACRSAPPALRPRCAAFASQLCGFHAISWPHMPHNKQRHALHSAGTPSLRR